MNKVNDSYCRCGHLKHQHEKFEDSNGNKLLRCEWNQSFNHRCRCVTFTPRNWKEYQLTIQENGKR